MTTEYLLDTNVCIAIRDLLGGRGSSDLARQQRLQSLRERWEGVDGRQLAMSLITLGELEFGVAKSGRPEARQRFDTLRQAVAVLLPDAAVAAQYGDIRHQLQSRGEAIGANDTWIAAQGRATGRTVVTNNTREFDRVPGLRTEDWMA
jgi:tRNA(fMet)-specific endonuclease VapC